MTQVAEKACNKVLTLVVQNFDYFRANPVHLAWAMMNFELFYRVGSRLGEDFDNPTDLVIDAGEDLPRKEEDSSLLYDAWMVTDSMDSEFPDTNPKLLLESKKNKTLDEWVELFTDKRYRCHDLFPDDKKAKDHLLCSCDTGMGWNAQGFIADIGRSGTDLTIFAGYTRVGREVRKDLREKIMALRNSNPAFAKAVTIYLRKTQRFTHEVYTEGHIPDSNWWKRMKRRTEAMKKVFAKADELIKKYDPSYKEDLPKLSGDSKEKHRCYYPLSEYFPLVTMPKNAHESYVKAGLEIAREILTDSKQRRESKPYARRFIKKWE